MIVKSYLYINNRGSVRLTRSKQDTKADEIRFLLHISVPDAAFKQPDPVIEVNLADEVKNEAFLGHISSQNDPDLGDFSAENGDPERTVKTVTIPPDLNLEINAGEGVRWRWNDEETWFQASTVEDAIRDAIEWRESPF